MVPFPDQNDENRLFMAPIIKIITPLDNYNRLWSFFLIFVAGLWLSSCTGFSTPSTPRDRPVLIKLKPSQYPLFNDDMVYDVRRNGEAFGWSSLIGRDIYSTSAECIEPTKLLKTDSKKLRRILEKDPANGVVFFRQLAATLGNRLIESYKR